MNPGRVTRLGGALALMVTACNIQPQAFANGSTQMVGTVTVALELQPNPPRVGRPTSLVFTLRNVDHVIGPWQTRCDVTLDMPKMPMNISPISADSDADGRCQVSYTFAMAGGWSAGVRLGGQENAQGQARFAFDVGP